MKIVYKARLFQKTLELERQKGRSVGFVPTMGALHEGHLALVRTSQKKNKITAVSIFVNPAQFGPNEDFQKYPRVLSQDCRLLREAGVHYLFYPVTEEIYPSGDAFTVKLNDAAVFAKGLCGRFRPGHFEGVATVVTKLFILAGACRAYFGAKDYQQSVVVKNLVKDMLLPVEVMVCPTVREQDGLAMSSRNRYLAAEERAQAVQISKVLFALRSCLEEPAAVLAGLDLIKKQAVQNLERAGLKVQYFDFADPETLLSIKQLQPRILAATACYAGKTRLIDNVIISVPKTVMRRLNRKRPGRG